MGDSYYALDENSALAYVKNSKLASDFFNKGEALKCRDLADGNINLVFRVNSEAAPQTRSLIVKQALPHSRRYPDFKIPLERAELEYQMLKIEGEFCPALVPKVYLYDPAMYLIAMEDLNNHLIMREGIKTQIIYPKFAKDAADFMAATLFYTSDLYLDSAEKKARQKKFVNPVLCKVTEDLYFTFPFIEHDTNRCNPDVLPFAQHVRDDKKLRAETMELKALFMNNTEALLHGDLHTGSVMLNPADTRIIDPEFGFYGPMAFDIGSLLGNLVIAHAAQLFYAKGKHESYQLWIRKTIREIWETFEANFRAHWDSKGRDEWKSEIYQDNFINRLLKESAGFAGCEIFRRTIGMAHVSDIEGINDPKKQAEAVLNALTTGENWLKNWKDFSRIDDLIKVME